MREYADSDINHFRGACEQLAAGGPGEFMISPGDIDPPEQVYECITEYIGDDYIWYPAVGNHESETDSDMNWLRSYNPGGNSLPAIVHSGPSNSLETCYSFEYGNLHVSVINEYYDGSSDTGSDGNVDDALHEWLLEDLSATEKPIILVVGHEPAYPQPDEESGRLRHSGDSLDQYPAYRDRFWNTLETHGVTAYICGHTHNYSNTLIGSVRQIDVGHARGTADTGASSTFLMFYLMAANSLWCYTYRLNLDSLVYELTDRTLI